MRGLKQLHCCERGMFSIKKFSETVEIGKGGVQPF
jgi:hypothetical protein